MMSTCQHASLQPRRFAAARTTPATFGLGSQTQHRKVSQHGLAQLPSQRFTEPCNACCIDLQLFKIVVINWGMHRVHKPWRTNLELKGIIAELWYRVKIMSLSNIGPSPKVFLCWWRQQNIVSSYSETNNCVRARCIKNFKGWIAGFIPLCGLLEQKPSWQLCKTRQQ